MKRRNSFITLAKYGASGKLLCEIRRSYDGPWALATGDPFIELAEYAFYSDGTESGSVIVGTKNSQQTLDIDPIYFCRFLIKNTGTYAYKNLALEFEYNHESGGWTSITTTSSVVKAVDSGNVATGDDCTQRIGSGTFHADNDGVCEDGVTCGGGSLDLALGEECEILLVFQVVSGDVSHGDEVLIRPVFEGGAELDNYVYSGADIDINKPAAARRVFVIT